MRLFSCSALVALSLWCAEGAIAAPLPALALQSGADAHSARHPGLVHVAARWYPPSYDDEGYSPPGRYLPPPVSYYRHAPRKPVVIYEPPPYWQPPTVYCGRRRCVVLPQW